MDDAELWMYFAYSHAWKRFKTGMPNAISNADESGQWLEPAYVDEAERYYEQRFDPKGITAKNLAIT